MNGETGADAQVLSVTQAGHSGLLAFLSEWGFPGEQAQDFIADHDTGQGLSWICESDGAILGALTLRWRSNDPTLAARNCAFIHNVIVAESHRRHGIGSRLLDAAEHEARRRGHPMIGLAVPVTSEFGPAQRLYARRAYLPDGRGLCIGPRPVKRGERVVIGEEAIWWMLKSL